MSTQNQPKKTPAFPNSEIPGNVGPSAAAPAETEGNLKTPGLVAGDKGRPETPKTKKRKDELQVTIAPGLQDTSDIALEPPR